MTRHHYYRKGSLLTVATVLLAGFILVQTHDSRMTMLTLLFLIMYIQNSIQTQLIMSKLSELQSTLDSVNGTLLKAKGEIVAEVAALEATIAASSDPELPAATEASLTRLKNLAVALDDLNADAPTPTDTPEATPEPTPEVTPEPTPEPTADQG